MSKILLLDNHDSFTHILAQTVRLSAGREVFVTQDMPTERVISEVSAVILSPGPGVPNEHPVMMQLIDICIDRNIPLLGVCLGMQALWEQAGGRLRHMGSVVHGEVYEIELLDDPIWQGIGEKMAVGRYHSWCVDDMDTPRCYRIIAHDAADIPMAIRHVERPIVAVQFHPESYMTTHGRQMLANFFS